MNNILKSVVEEKLTVLSGTPVIVRSVRPAGGGCINEAAALETSAGMFFAKWNNAGRYPGMFEAEMKGLEVLAGAGCIAVPKPIGVVEAGDISCLLMHYIQQGRRQEGFGTLFGQQVAALHRNTSEFFGSEHDNYIGSLKQYNTQRLSWEAFFAEMRLEVQAAMAYNAGLLKQNHIRDFERLYARLGEIFPHEAPALVHGDLWGGNYMTGAAGAPVLIDPAVYYGHREMDMAMSRLFGGFEAAFYDAYTQNYPLEKGWQNRSDICNLYPLLVHLNLFGGSYLSGIERIIRIF